MGKGEIISHIADGRYNVRLLYDHTRTDVAITALDEQVGLLDTRIAGLPAGSKKAFAQLQRVALLKRKEYLQANVTETAETTAWCGDLTEDLSGTVGTIEVPGEIGSVNVQPGYDSNAVYSSDRDGQMQSSAAADPCAYFYNIAMLPGWQKWMPTYRYGTITAIDYEADTCSVTLEAATSSAQSLNINYLSSLSNVPVEYMQCNSSAFEVGDSVIVAFEGVVKTQAEENWATPKVIGFKDNPKGCYWESWDGPTISESHPWTQNSGAGYEATVVGGSLVCHSESANLSGVFYNYITGADPSPPPDGKMVLEISVTGSVSGSQAEIRAWIYDDSQNLVVLDFACIAMPHPYGINVGLGELSIDLTDYGLHTKVRQITFAAYSLDGVAESICDYLTFS